MGHNLRRRSGSLLLAVALFLASPMLAVASAAADPISLGDWMNAIFATPSRKIDPSEKGTAAAPPPPIQPQLQTANEPAPPKEPLNSTPGPRLWFRGDSARRRRRRLK